MVIYQLDYVVEEVRKNEPSREQKMLKNMVGKDFKKQEAALIWEKIGDHKWYLGERLKRDVGTRVAAVDYIENFYEPVNFFKKHDGKTGIFRRFINSVASLGRAYFVSKSRIFTD